MKSKADQIMHVIQQCQTQGLKYDIYAKSRKVTDIDMELYGDNEGTIYGEYIKGFTKEGSWGLSKIDNNWKPAKFYLFRRRNCKKISCIQIQIIAEGWE